MNTPNVPVEAPSVERFPNDMPMVMAAIAAIPILIATDLLDTLFSADVEI